MHTELTKSITYTLESNENSQLCLLLASLSMQIC